jgi:hypothetical protein
MTFVLTLRTLPGVEPTRAIRRLLKFAARSCGLRCTHIQCDPLGSSRATNSGLQRSQEGSLMSRNIGVYTAIRY